MDFEDIEVLFYYLYCACFSNVGSLKVKLFILDKAPNPFVGSGTSMGIKTCSLLGPGFEPGIWDLGCSLVCLEVLVSVGKVDKKLDNPFVFVLPCEFVSILISLRLSL
mgnify:CR=1 FL=1